MTISVKDFAKYFGLSEDSQVVGWEELYNDNDGNYFVVYLFDGAEVHRREVRMTSHPMYSFNPADFMAKELYDEANEIYRDTKVTKRPGSHEWSDCEVILHKSRKAPNGIPLEVTGFLPACRAGRYFVGEQIIVKIDEDEYAVSIGCVKVVTKGKPIPRSF